MLMTNRCFNSTCTVNFEIAGKNFSKRREYSTVVASQFSFLEAGGAGVGVGGGGGGDDGGGEGGSDVFNKKHEHRSRIYLVKKNSMWWFLYY